LQSASSKTQLYAAPKLQNFALPVQLLPINRLRGYKEDRIFSKQPRTINTASQCSGLKVYLPGVEPGGYSDSSFGIAVDGIAPGGDFGGTAPARISTSSGIQGVASPTASNAAILLPNFFSFLK
jgi:hypothetical protein